MKQIKAVILSIMLLSIFNACVPAPIVVGAVVAGGGTYSITNGTIKDVFNVSKESAFENFVSIIADEEGQVKVSSIAEGKIEAKIGVSLVFITIVPQNENSIKVTISAKKHIELLPDKNTAVRIYRLFIKKVTK